MNKITTLMFVTQEEIDRKQFKAYVKEESVPLFTGCLFIILVAICLIAFLGIISA